MSLWFFQYIPMATQTGWAETVMLVIGHPSLTTFLYDICLWFPTISIPFPKQQKDFIDLNSPLCVAGGPSIVPSVIKAIASARERGVFMVWVVREHDPRGRDVELFRRHLYVDRKGPTIKGSVGAELVDGLVVEEGDYKLVKTRFSAFFDTPLHSVLQTHGINNLVVVGVQTPNCIRQTVFDAVALNYQSVTVMVDATAAATPEVHTANIMDMRNVGVSAVTVQEWCLTKA